MLAENDYCMFVSDCCVFLQGAREEGLHLLRRFYKVSLLINTLSSAPTRTSSLAYTHTQTRTHTHAFSLLVAPHGPPVFSTNTYAKCHTNYLKQKVAHMVAVHVANEYS